MVSNPFPARIPILLERWVDGVEDDLGNVTGGYGAPEPHMVIGVEPTISTEPELAGHDRVVVDAKMYAPLNMRPVPQDRVTVRGMVFDVIGYPQDADLGPWWDLPCSTILLHRVEAR